VGQTGPAAPAWVEQLLRLAPYLSQPQIAFILKKVASRWEVRDVDTLRAIAEIKRQIGRATDGAEGKGYIPQALAIALFLGQLIGLGRDAAESLGDFLAGGAQARENEPFQPTGILGPEDVARLMQANIAAVSQTRVVEVNERMLLNYIGSQPAGFFTAVLMEMSLNNPRILAGILIALLDQDQRHLKAPLDLPRLFSAWLGQEIPQRRDYMAGGRWAKESYYQAVLVSAESILEKAKPYLARRLHLQVARQRLPAAWTPPASSVPLIQAARQLIENADRLGALCRFGAESSGPLDEAKQAYDAAFKACAKLLDHDPAALTSDWLRHFWARNHEALVILSVVRNYQASIDRVRNWVQVRSGRHDFAHEQDILETIVSILYYFPEDQAKLLADPLVRLLIDPPAGHYRFTIVSAMGVVTEGAKGSELEDAYQRLFDQRGIRVIRADTATAKRLEYNAEKIEAAIRKVKTPWGIIGYSQGCANSLMAESLLRGGTPAQQKLLTGLTCRNFLFSAINGSAHGSCGIEKFRQAMVEGENIIKHYQGVLSGNLIQLILRNISLIFDSRIFIHLMGGVDSLSHEGVVTLGRDAQFLPVIPTSTVRGVVSPAITPEPLEFLSNVISRQVNGARHDTQVTLVSAVGHPNRVMSEQARHLAACDMGSLAQHSHHWSPLLKETTFITTARDIERAIYDFPKDRHIFPWIEVNARFGRITRV
jgi:hypothetical protein